MPVRPEESTKKSEDLSTGDLAARLDELEVLVRQNIQWSEVLHHDTKRIKRRLSLMVLGNWIRLIIILTPFILAAIFIPPYYRQAKDWYIHNIQNPQQKFQGNVDKFLQYLPGNENTPTQP